MVHSWIMQWRSPSISLSPVYGFLLSQRSKSSNLLCILICVYPAQQTDGLGSLDWGKIHASVPLPIYYILDHHQLGLCLSHPTEQLVSPASSFPHGERRVLSTAASPHWLLQPNQRTVFSHVIHCLPFNNYTQN